MSIRRILPALLVGLLTLATGPSIAPDVRAADRLPKRLSDRAFWRMVEEFSEPNGAFGSDNLLSNETTLQEVIPPLQRAIRPNGVYLGVGPDQNFTYITALRPRIAFIVDIRRQNLVEHLFYKALLELSKDRADFLSRLFGRPRPDGLSPGSTVDELFDAYRGLAPSEDLFRKNDRDVLELLVKKHKFTLTTVDFRNLEFVARAFFVEGPQLRYSFPRQNGIARAFPTYAQLMLATDAVGEQRGYLASEANYRALRDFERDNLLVPIVGDFAGPKALRAVARYLREHGETVDVLYTSNVEQYLVQTDAWPRWVDNVAALPINPASTFIRSYFDKGFFYPPGVVTSDLHSVQLLDPIATFLTASRAGDIRTYLDLVDRSRSAAVAPATAP